MEAKYYTKGQWEINGSLDNIEVIVNDEENGRYIRIASVKCYDHHIPNYEESESNAKLIAAAPEMLEALNEILNFHLKYFKGSAVGANARMLAEKAIKKALDIKAIKKATE